MELQEVSSSSSNKSPGYSIAPDQTDHTLILSINNALPSSSLPAKQATIDAVENGIARKSKTRAAIPSVITEWIQWIKYGILCILIILIVGSFIYNLFAPSERVIPEEKLNHLAKYLETYYNLQLAPLQLHLGPRADQKLTTTPPKSHAG